MDAGLLSTKSLSAVSTDKDGAIWVQPASGKSKELDRMLASDDIKYLSMKTDEELLEAMAPQFAMVQLTATEKNIITQELERVAKAQPPVEHLKAEAQSL